MKQGLSSALLFSLVSGVAALAGCSGAAPVPVEGATAQTGASAPQQPTDDGSGSSPGSSEDDAGAAPGANPGAGAGPHPGSASSDAGATPDAGPSPVGAGPGASSAIEFAPYFPTWTWGSGGYAYSSLTDLQTKSGIKAVTIAFVLSGGGCAADQGIEQNLDDVKAFIAAGGHVKASFGGADGTYLESQCGDAASLAKAIGDFVTATGITDLDFDIEQDPVLTDAVNERRGQALKIVQDAQSIKVAFTLAANAGASGSPGGLTPQGLSVVSHAVGAGVTVSHVNLMMMDYGDSFAGSPLAPVVLGSLDGAHAQLMSTIPGLTAGQAWAMIGVIAMIGKNDDAEIFSLADAKAVAAFAVQNHLGLVSFWSIDRDQVCPNGADYNSCSTVNPANFAFSAIFETVTP